MHLALLHVVVCIFVPFVGARPTRQSQPQYTRLVVFGDSFSDNGSGAWTVSNMTWPADPAYFNHSFSNGPVWPGRLAESLGIQLLDYGVGGATADNTFVTGYTGPESTIEVPSANDQLLHFLNVSTPEDGDVFVHYIGANDAFFDTNITGAELTSLINRDVDLLYRAGAKTILLANYPLVNSFPATYGSQEYAFAPTYAETMTLGLNNIAAGWSPYLSIGVVDVQALFVDIVEHPADYGILEEYVNPPTACLQGAYPSEGVARSLCDDAGRHLFFDAYHPVTGVHARIAELFGRALEGL